jgi:hypothetical protein
MHGDYYYLFYCKTCKNYYQQNKADSTLQLNKWELSHEEIYDYAIPCPLCLNLQQHRIKFKRDNKLKDNRNNFEYPYVRAKGNTGKLYCINHPHFKHNRYDFQHRPEHTEMTIQKLIELLNIDDIENESLLKILLEIKVPKTQISKIIGKSRPTIDNIIKNRDEIKTIDNVDIKEKITTISLNKEYPLETIIRIPLETLLYIEDKFGKK